MAARLLAADPTRKRSRAILVTSFDQETTFTNVYFHIERSTWRGPGRICGCVIFLVCDPKRLTKYDQQMAKRGSLAQCNYMHYMDNKLLVIWTGNQNKFRPNGVTEVKLK
jgi:hypothetical protein